MKICFLPPLAWSRSEDTVQHSPPVPLYRMDTANVILRDPQQMRPSFTRELCYWQNRLHQPETVESNNYLVAVANVSMALLLGSPASRWQWERPKVA